MIEKKKMFLSKFHKVGKLVYSNPDLKSLIKNMSATSLYIHMSEVV